MYFFNKNNTPQKPSKHKPQVFWGLLVLACSVFAVPVAEAAKPVASIAKVAAVNEGTVVNLDGSGSSDKDGDKLTYKWVQTNIKSGTPTVTLAKATTATATFTAPAIAKTNKVTKPVTLTFQLTVSDGTSSVNKSVSVSVKPVNALPVANAGTDKAATYAAAESGVALDGSKTKDDGQIIKYQWSLLTKTSSLPKGAKFKLSNATASAATFTLTGTDQATSLALEFQLLVTDNDNKQAKDTVVVTLMKILPPVANAGADQTVISEAAVSLSGAQSTGAITTYAWKQTAGPTVALSSTNAAATGFTAPTVTAATALTFELTTTNGGGSSTDSVVVTVNPKPLPLPVANAGIDQTVVSGTTVNLSGAASTGTIASYAWKQTVGPTVALSSANTVATSFAAPTVAATTALTFELTTTNATGTSKDTVVVTVNAPAPVLAANLSLPVGVLDINDPTVAAINSISGGTGPYTVAYNWGDGQTTAAVQLGAGVVTHSSEHYYAKNGSYTIKVTLTDANKFSKEFSGAVAVSDVEECK